MSDQLDSFEGPSGQGALVRLLYPAPAERSAGAIIAWWERRRFAYNVIVGACGVVTLGFATLVHGGAGDMLGAVFPVAIMANVAYSLGSLIEIAVHGMWGRKVLPVGPMLFRQGVLFSVGLTLVLPAIILTIGAVVKTLAWVFVG